jgi:hypothetical protein
MKKFLLFLVFNICLMSIFSEDIIVSLNNGRRAILHQNYTWEYIDDSKSSSIQIENESIYKGKLGIANIRYNSKKWKIVDPFSQTTELSFLNMRGDGYASFVEERIQVPLENMKDVLLRSLDTRGLKATNIESSIKNISNKDFLVIRIDGVISGINIVYLYKIWSGSEGTVQLIVFTGANLFDEYNNDFNEFLNGLELNVVN